MNKLLKKSIYALTVSAVVLSSAGCEKKEISTNDDNISLSWFVVNNDMPADGVSDVMKEAQKATGVLLKSDVSKNNTNYEQALTLMMSSGQLSDIITIKQKEAENYGKSGALVALDTLMDKYAPNFKKYLDENPDIKKELTCVDGHIYYIPFLFDTDAMKVSTSWFIRKDWLKKLNLETPTNAEELENVLKAFVEKDPNGNGKKDEIGYFSRFYNPNALTSLWGASIDYYIEDGKVKYGPAEPEFKEAMKNISRWMKEGIIDLEIYTRSNSRDVLLSGNQGGCTIDWITSTSQYNSKLSGKIDGFDFCYMLPPVNTKGNIYHLESRVKNSGTGWSISIQNKYPEKSMEFFDYWFTDEGSRLANYGIEGKQYDMKDGVPMLNDSVKNSDIAALDVLHSVGAQWNELGYKQDYRYEKQLLSDSAIEALNMYQNKVTFMQKLPNVSYFDEEFDEMTNIDGNLFSRVSEVVQQWVLGQLDVDVSYDSYVKELENLGLSKAIKIHQDAYNRYLEN